MTKMTDKEYLQYIETELIPNMLEAGCYEVVQDFVRLLQISREGIEEY